MTTSWSRLRECQKCAKLSSRHMVATLKNLKYKITSWFHVLFHSFDVFTIILQCKKIKNNPWMSRCVQTFDRYCISHKGIFLCHFLFFAGISNAEARQPGKAPNFSVNWAVGDQGLEVINAMTGKDDLGRPSRLCKHALYSRWVRLYCKVGYLTPTTPYILSCSCCCAWLGSWDLLCSNNSI